MRVRERETDRQTERELERERELCVWGGGIEGSYRGIVKVT